MAWEKKMVYVVTAFFKDDCYSSPSEEFITDTWEEAVKLQKELQADEDYDEVFISDEKEEREVWKSDKLDEMVRRAGEIIRNKNLNGQQKDEKLADLLTELECDYNIPLLKNPEWESANPKLYKTYKAISDMREL